MIDLTVGMNRTGMDIDDFERVAGLARATLERGVRLVGLHAYDGHLAMLPAEERTAAIRAAFERLLRLLESLHRAGIHIESVVTSGSITFVTAAHDDLLSGTGVHHQVLPGTVVYSDITTAEHLEAVRYQTAVHVLSRVISAPLERYGDLMPAIRRCQPTPGFRPARWSADHRSRRRHRARSTFRSTATHAICRRSAT
jgi:D-serine deaminase-like pyridoxal phosphate-dependent protein